MPDIHQRSQHTPTHTLPLAGDRKLTMTAKSDLGMPQGLGSAARHGPTSAPVEDLSHPTGDSHESPDSRDSPSSPDTSVRSSESTPGSVPTSSEDTIDEDGFQRVKRKKAGKIEQRIPSRQLILTRNPFSKLKDLSKEQFIGEQPLPSTSTGGATPNNPHPPRLSWPFTPCMSRVLLTYTNLQKCWWKTR